MSTMAEEIQRRVTAKAKWVRMSAFKAREVANLIRGKQIDEARRILTFTPKAACHHISKVLESAVANAEHNFQIPQEELFIRLAEVDEGVTIKRFRPRAQGRAYRIRKRTCHIRLTLERMPRAAVETRAPRRGGPAAKANETEKTPSRSRRKKEGETS
ncbi:MAG: 50S ribosomal protein L22 [Actinomycetota bacterium]